MKPFSEVWAFTNTIPGSFTEMNASKLYEYACQVPDGGLIVEVGVDQGRSASVLLEASQGRTMAVYLIDKWESVLHDNQAKVEALIEKLPECWRIVRRGSSVDEASGFDNESIDLIHIDAHHYDDIADGGPELDCAMWLPKVKRGGIACLHDVQSCFPDVDRAVANHLSTWESLGVWEGLGIWRKPQC